MTSDDSQQCLLQRGPVQTRGHRQQHRLVPVMRLGRVQLEEPSLGRQKGQVAGLRFGRSGNDSGHLRHGCQLRNRLVLEDLLRREADARPLGPRNDLEAEDRITAELEEVVRHANSLEPQHVGPDAGEGCLDIRGWRGECRVDRPG